MRRILLERAYTDLGTLGRFNILEGGALIYSCATIERPWKNNERRVSCFPEGDYTLRLRNSPIVQRTTKGKFTQGWEVTDVLDRSEIMIHIANYVDDLLGCIGVGERQTILEGKIAVANSGICFTALMAQLQVQTEWEMKVTARHALFA